MLIITFFINSTNNFI